MLEGNGDIDVEFRNDEARVGRDGAGHGWVNRLNTGGRGFGIRRNISHDGGKDEAVILHEKSAENDEKEDENWDEALSVAVFANLAAGDTFVLSFSVAR